ncbi:hypothetical protein N7490_003345 [Penicillium lividum]|nr:hypothetical protein N7490_003345 [Penicillium lividum]
MSLEGLDITQESLDQILKEYNDDLVNRSLNIIALGKIKYGKRDTQGGSERYVYGNVIRLLPENCQIRIDPTTNFIPGPPFPAAPVWDEIIGPHEFVGLTRKEIPLATKRHRDTALQKHPLILPSQKELHLRPQLTRPYFDFDAEGYHFDITYWKEGYFYINPEHEGIENLTKIALDLLKKRKVLFETQLSKFRISMRNWRIQRRRQELTLLENEWMYKEESNHLPPDFGHSHLIGARRHMVIENAKERAGLISPFEVGVLEKEHEEKIAQPFGWVIKEMTAIDKAMEDLEKMIAMKDF